MNRAFATLQPLLIASALACGASTGSAQDDAGSGGGGASPSRASGPAAPAPRHGLSVGVVDFAKILEAYPRAREELKKIDELKNRRQDELDQIQKRISEFAGLRDNFKEGSQEWLQKDLDRQLAMRALDGKRQIYNVELRDEREKFYVTMLEDMQRAVAVVAKEREVGLVLKVHEDLLDGSIESKARIFESRVVWYAAEEIDLTPAVIKLLQVPLPKLPHGGDKAANGRKDSGEQP